MDNFLNLFSKEQDYLGGESAHIIALLFICMVMAFYFLYYASSQFVKRLS